MVETEKVVGEKSDSFHYGEYISIAELRCKITENESHGTESFSQATARIPNGSSMIAVETIVATPLNRFKTW